MANEEIEVELEGLIGELWVESVSNLAPLLKSELQGTKGWVKHALMEAEVRRKQAMDVSLARFKSSASLAGLDEHVDLFASAMLSINSTSKEELVYGFPIALRAYRKSLLARDAGDSLDFGDKEFSANIQYPVISACLDFMEVQGWGSDPSMRLIALFGNLIFQSLSQSNKSQAGNAGERIVRSVFELIGLEEGRHFTTQFKSGSGSATDFVLPYVERANLQDVEVMVAVQMSSNDRARLSQSELKIGGTPYLVIGNGLRASSKPLSAIGDEIISDMKNKNVRLVCIAAEIKKERERVEAKLDGLTESSLAYVATKIRLEYLKTHVKSWEKFAAEMRDRFVGRF